jgi:hypothetical protein
MLWVIAFIEADWAVQWMKWEVFSKIILSGDFSSIRKMHVNLIAGGFSLATDYMHVVLLLIYHH